MYSQQLSDFNSRLIALHDIQLIGRSQFWTWDFTENVTEKTLKNQRFYTLSHSSQFIKGVGV